MKRVYFVRHGETVANVKHMVQGLDDPLSETGEKQVLRIGERAKNITFDALIASDAIRTQQTAKAIQDATGIAEIELSPLFREAKRPTSFIGKTWDTPEYVEMMLQEEQHWGEEGWHFDDEENYDDLKERAQDAIAYIEGHEKDTLLVVSHGRFLRYLIAGMIFGDTLTPTAMWRMDRALRTMNTGITVCYQGEEDGKVEWKVLTWNDHAHFAE